MDVREAEGADLEAAHALVASAYSAAGLGEPSPVPGAVTFVLLDGGAVAATLSLVRDSEDGLPCQTLFSEEIDDLRNRTRRLAEFTRFASVQPLSRSAFMSLSGAAFRHHFQAGGDALVACVHPDHARVYRAVFGFERLGETKAHAGMGGAPASLNAVTADALWEGRRAVWWRLFPPFNMRA
jgi:hypothetical protein